MKNNHNVNLDRTWKWKGPVQQAAQQSFICQHLRQLLSLYRLRCYYFLRNISHFTQELRRVEEGECIEKKKEEREMH
jgi:hypothetical protein